MTMNKRVKRILSLVTRKSNLEFSNTKHQDDKSDTSHSSSCIMESKPSNDVDRAKRKKGKKAMDTKNDVREDTVTSCCENVNASINRESSQNNVMRDGNSRQAASDSRKNRDSIGQCSMTSSISARESRGLSFEEETPRLSDEVELTDDQKAELKQAFSMFEKTGKGRIQARDLGELLRCLGWNPSEQDLEEARHELELSTRGTISFSEVEAYIARRGGIYYGNNAEEDIMVAFQVLDKTGSGKITVSDFRHFMTTMGERMSHEEVEELIECSTRGGKDYIEYRDLVHAVQQSPT